MQKAQVTATQKAVDELVLMDEFQEYAKAQQAAAKPINHTESKSVAGAAQSNVSNANRGVTADTQGAGQQADVTGRASDNPVPASPKPQQRRNDVNQRQSGQRKTRR